MGLLRSIKNLAAPSPRFDTKQFRKYVFAKNPDVREHRNSENSLILSIPLVAHRGILSKIAKRMQNPDSKKYELDLIGEFVWAQISGTANVESIINKLTKHFKMNWLEAETALINYLQLLGKRGLIIPSQEKKSNGKK